MAQMQALLKIKADVEGEGQVNALGRAIGGLSNTAGRVSGGLKDLAGAAGGLSGALGALVPVVSISGLAAMGKSAIDAADDMNDLSQKTGVSVEQLSRFQQAANASGTSIEGVGAAMLQFTKRFQGGAGPAADALKELSISATDANGKLKSTDKIMLEVADKFAAMEDGEKKATLSMQLFGKAGADMIPMLNGGRKSIEDLAATMTGPFAKGADGLNDKLATLQGKLLILGVGIGTALMPMLNGIANAVLAATDAFAALPGPLQAIVGGVVALTAALVILAPAISAIISIAGALAGLQLGATIAGWLGAVGPMVAGITAALGGLLAWITGTLIPGLLAVFTGPVGWTILAVAAVVAMCIAFREPIGKFFVWLGSAIGNGLNALWKWGEPIRNFWKGVWDGVKNLASNAWNGIVNGIKAAFRGVLQNVANQINGAASLVNRLIVAFNRLPAPDIPLIPTLNVPAFAQGGVVTKPTLAMVGEGGEAEYIIPQSKMATASANYLAGSRGAGIMNGSSGNTSINITTGPVVEFNGERYVTLADMERGLQQMASNVLNGLRTPAGRYAVGVR